MSLALDIFRVVLTIVTVVLVLRILRMSRGMRHDMTELKCPHCHEPIFPRLP